MNLQISDIPPEILQHEIFTRTDVISHYPSYETCRILRKGVTPQIRKPRSITQLEDCCLEGNLLSIISWKIDPRIDSEFWKECKTQGLSDNHLNELQIRLGVYQKFREDILKGYINRFFIAACRGGHLEIMDLMSRGAEDAGTWRNALNIALIHAKESSVGYLEAHGPPVYSDPSREYREKHHRLMAASSGGSITLFELMLGRMPESQDPALWYEALVAACRNGRLKLVKFILKKSKTLEIYDYNEALPAACSSGSEAVVELLISMGADCWDEALRAVVTTDSLQIANFLISRGASDWNGAAEAVSDIAPESLSTQMVWWLISSMGSFKASRGFWENCLYLAAFRSDLKLLELAIEKGASSWSNLLDAVSSSGNLEFLELILQKGAKNLESGLCIASSHGHLDVVKRIALEIEERDRKKLPVSDRVVIRPRAARNSNIWNTFLYYACNRTFGIKAHGVLEMIETDQQVRMEIVEFFITKGASNWKAGLSGACQSGDLFMMRVMIQKGALECSCSNPLISHLM